ncbi:MAG: flagellar basal body P-ring formation protein FlgA [Desulfosarcina sp.]|nr:flagellar basal body P-ring formation protein FlgA [Desulfobacterales bacterium]
MKQLLSGIFMGLVLILMLWTSVVRANVPQPVVLTAADAIEINAPRIMLGQIVRIAPPQADMAARLAQIKIGRAPLAGQTRSISREYIMLRLRQSGFDPADFDIRMPAKIRVRRGAVEISREELEMMIRDHIMAAPVFEETEINVTMVRIKEDVVVPKGQLRHEIQLQHQSAPSRMLPATIVLKVDGQFVRNVSALVSLEIMQNVVVSRKPIPRFKVIEAEDVMLRKMNVAGLSGNTIRALDSVIGKRARRALGMYAELCENMVEWPPVVQKGDRVVILAQSGNLRITALGEVKGTAKVGQRVRVVNLDSNKIIMAQVIDRRTVRVTF